jgi:hypothetical protein
MYFGKAHYFLIFIDDCSRNTWVYFLREKSGVFSHFLEFKALVEKESGLKTLTLQTYNGGKYKSNEPFELLQEEWNKARVYQFLVSSTKWSCRKEK